ncbi:MAG: CotH kinase family protein [Chitinispirillaceae bacterium]|nr:CotH kinase family protein [Chitinispirillaceae bacterium]
MIKNKIFTISFTASLLIVCNEVSNAEVVINEFMANNFSIYPDMCDYDDFSDWIELYNPDTAEVDLNGYYLTDNFNNPRKWAIPEGVKIAARGFLVIRADGADSKPGVVDTLDSYPWNVPFTTNYYHTNFKLADEGEEIGLYKDSGEAVVCIDSVMFFNQLADVSWGRNPVDGKWYKYDEPTPDAPNTTDPKEVEVYSGSVDFSIPGGFYDGPQTLVMSVASGEMYYTTDGSTPFKNSETTFKYTGPIAVETTIVVRARCIEPDRIAGKVTTNTYFIGGNEKRSLMTVSITTDTSFLYDEEIGIFTNSRKDREILVAMEFFTPDGRQVSKVNAGMTLGSLTNFTFPQKPLQIRLRNRYGDDYVRYQMFDKRIACFQRLRLRQGGDAWTNNLIADGVLESMCKGQLELGVQAYRPVVLFINGHYYGIHDLREQFDDQYFTNNYNVDPTTKEEVRSTLLPVDGKSVEGWELVDGSWEGYNALLELARSGDMTDALYDEIKERVNINSFIDYFCAVVFGKQISWGHNQDLWKVNTTKWQWLCTDFDRAFVYSDRFADIDHNLFTEGAGASGGIMEADSLFPKLMINENFKNCFTQRFAAHLNATFKPSRMRTIVDSLAALLDPEMEEYTDKWGPQGGVKSHDAWMKQIDSIKLFCTERPKYIFQFLTEEPFGYSGTALLSVTLDAAGAGDIQINGVRMCAGLENMTFVRGCPMRVTAVAKPGYVFAGWDGSASDADTTLTLTDDTTRLTALFVKSEDHLIPATISADTTFSLTDHSYIASGDVTVDTGATLTVEEGVTILMPQNACIYIRGRLLVNGTADAPVRIRENAKDGATCWGALNFENAVLENRITWAEITGTTSGHDALNERGGINGNGSNTVFDHLTMYNVIYPMYFEYGSTTIRNSTITVDHLCNGAVHIGRGRALVENSIWYSTGVTMNTDAIDIKGVENGIVRGNLVYNFNGFNSDAIDLGESCKSILITNNIVYGSYDKGISVGGKSTAKITNNLVVDCDLGIGIKDDFSYVDMDHNTFVRNRIAIATYAKAFGRGGGAAKVTNCILAASKASSIYEDRYSSIEIAYSLSDVDILPGTGNLFADPYFTDIMKNNLQLDPASPCINAGDPSFRRDADGSVTDIGAQYTFDSADFPDSLVPHYTPPAVVISELMYNDDKAHPGGDWIELYNPSDEAVDLSKWKLTDEGDYRSWLKSIDVAELDSDDVFLVPPGTKLGNGGYLVICADTAAFRQAYPDANGPVIGNLPFGFNGTETVLLYDVADVLVNAVCFDTTPPWPTAPDGDGPSLELVHADRFNFHPGNWDASKNTGGTPGQDNSASPVVRSAKPVMPLTYLLAQSYPNPCRAATTIRFALPARDHVRISIYTISGRLLETLFDNKIDAGFHQIAWNAKRYSPGVYFYRIRAGRFTAARKLTVQ